MKLLLRDCKDGSGSILVTEQGDPVENVSIYSTNEEASPTVAEPVIVIEMVLQETLADRTARRLLSG
jgi:hypothetical protein